MPARRTNIFRQREMHARLAQSQQQHKDERHLLELVTVPHNPLRLG
jgi:hypothetical protein